MNTLKGHTDAINGLAFAPGGAALASACDDRTVRVFDLRDVYAKNIPFRSKELRRGATDVAFGASPSQLAVLTSGVAGAAGLAMLDWPATGQPEPAWERDSTHGGQPGLCLRSVSSTKGGAGVLISATHKTEIKCGGVVGGMPAIDPPARLPACPPAWFWWGQLSLWSSPLSQPPHHAPRPLQGV